MMEIGKHLNRRDMKQIPPSGLSRRDSLRWLAYGIKDNIGLQAIH